MISWQSGSRQESETNGSVRESGRREAETRKRQFVFCQLLAAYCLLAFSAIGQTIRITEVMANPSEAQGGQTAGEFIEIYNFGQLPVDLKEWTIADRDQKDSLLPFKSGGRTTLGAKSYALILDPDYIEGYTLLPETLLLKPGNNAIGNGLSTTDPIRVMAPDGTTVDTFTPPMAARNGISFERVSIEKPDTPSNWKLCTDLLGATPGRPTSPPKEQKPTTPPPPSLAGIVILNEILFRPKPDAPEWVELHNKSDAPAVLEGVTLGDSREKPATLPNGTISPKGYALVTRNAADFRELYPDTPKDTLILEAPLPILNDEGDSAVLKGADGAVIDQMAYGQLSPNAGQSLERRNPDLESARTDNWLLSVHLSGSTPGLENSVRHEPAERPILSASPNPFVPQNGPTQLHYNAPLTARVTLRVFNSAGVLVRTLLQDAPNGGKQALPWNGQNDAGETLPAGIYIAQLLALTDGKPYAASVALVLAEE